MEWILILACVALAFVNGANDNIKGVATLYGSAQLGYQPALALATASQIVGSLGSILIAGALVKVFSGKGLVPPEMFSPWGPSGLLVGMQLTGHRENAASTPYARRGAQLPGP
jgi:PiT family inorganic phosphate transporter